MRCVNHAFTQWSPIRCNKPVSADVIEVITKSFVSSWYLQILTGRNKTKPHKTPNSPTCQTLAVFTCENPLKCCVSLL